jgi:hypothetical protein
VVTLRLESKPFGLPCPSVEIAPVARLRQLSGQVLAQLNSPSWKCQFSQRCANTFLAARWLLQIAADDFLDTIFVAGHKCIFRRGSAMVPPFPSGVVVLPEGHANIASRTN